MCSVSAGVMEASRERISAAVPATNGAAAELPLNRPATRVR
jgi:hypothetical protein